MVGEIIVEIKTIENARYSLGQGIMPQLLCVVNGKDAGASRERALRYDRYAAIGLEDFFVIIPPTVHSPDAANGRHIRLVGYTTDRRYVALVRKFVDDVDNGRFVEGPVEIPK